MKLKYPLTLASNSPRRKTLLNDMGFHFDIVTFSTNEDLNNESDPKRAAISIAKKKAIPFLKQSMNRIILTADTIVSCNGNMMAKPANKSEAIDMLQSLSGEKHIVYTGICLTFDGEMHTDYDSTVVHFSKLGINEINYYIDKYRPFDKAGAYGIQEWIGMIGIEKISGSYFNVVGLPTHLIYKNLLKLNLISY